VLQIVNSTLVIETPLDIMNMQLGSELHIISLVNGATVTGTFNGLDEGTEFTDANGVYLWEIHYGAGGVTLKLAYLPEPATLTLLALGGLGLLRRRRRKSRVV